MYKRTCPIICVISINRTCLPVPSFPYFKCHTLIMQSGLSSKGPSMCLRLTERDGISTFQPGGLPPSPSASQGISGPHKPNKGAPGCPSPFPHSRLPSKSPATHLLTLENSTHLGTLKERESNPLVFFPKMRLTWTLSRFQSLENPWRFLGGRGGSRLGSL